MSNRLCCKDPSTDQAAGDDDDEPCSRTDDHAKKDPNGDDDNGKRRAQDSSHIRAKLEKRSAGLNVCDARMQARTAYTKGDRVAVCISSWNTCHLARKVEGFAASARLVWITPAYP
jgi:hypothetical protein